MPELPTRKELAETIHDADIRCVLRDPRHCPNVDSHRVAADAVLHRLMRDADTEWAQADEYGPLLPTFRTEAEAEDDWGDDDAISILVRRSVTFTGEWEPDA